MVDPQNLHRMGVVVEVVENAVRPAACAVGAFKITLQRLPNSARFSGQVAVDELDDRGHDPRRHPLKVPAGNGGEDDLVGHWLRLGTPNSARTCSSL